MDNATMAIFVHEIKNQCLYTEGAFNVFNQSFEQKASTGVFFAAQSTLLAVSQLACIIWPSSSRSRKRGEEIRKVLGLKESHPLNNSRVRALWDKGDEKLEKWISDTKGGNVIFDHLGEISLLDPNSFTEQNIYRLYDPKTSILYFRGDGYNMQAISNAVADIYTRVTQVHQTMFPDHYKKEGDAGSNDNADEKPKAKKATKKTTKKKPTAKKPAKKPAKKTVKKKKTS
ncbi:MAG: hypothetical protein KAR62_03780 [Sphingomonadales bacterium]|nr:hypothetical protein [Sphingomonadales bacterium]